MKANLKPFVDRVILGDCLRVMKLLPNESIDLVLCDLPYGVTDCAWDKRLPPNELFSEYRRLLAPKGAIVLTATQPFATDLINACRDWFRYDLVWDKVMTVGFLNANRMPLRRHELVLVFYPRLPIYHPQFSIGNPYKRGAGDKRKSGVYRATRSIGIDNPGRRYPSSILEFPRDANGGGGAKRLFHPTQKPLALFEYLVLTYTNPGAIVLDNCIGSGTTALASIATNRHYIGIEQDPEFVAIANQRIAELALPLRAA